MSNTGEDVELFEDAYIGDGFETWIATHNPEGLPVVQLETPADEHERDRTGGWLLRVKGPNGSWHPKVPLHARNDPQFEEQARAEAKAWIAAGEP